MSTHKIITYWRDEEIDIDYHGYRPKVGDIVYAELVPNSYKNIFFTIRKVTAIVTKVGIVFNVVID